MKYKIAHVKNGQVKYIYVFYANANSANANANALDKLFQKNPADKLFDGIFTPDELAELQANATQVRFLNEQIHLDDTIEIIKKKIVLHLTELNAAFEELYLFLIQPVHFNAATLYQNLTQNEKLELTKARLIQFLLNIEEIDVATLPDKEVYTYDDLLELNLEQAFFSVTKPLGQKLVALKDEYPYTVNPYHAEAYDAFLEKFADEIITTTNKNILLDHGAFLNQTLYLCLAEEVLTFAQEQQLPLAEASTLKIYFPYLYKKDITTLDQLTDRKQALLQETEALLTPVFKKNIENVNLFHDIYALRKEELKFKDVGIKSLILRINQPTAFHLPLDNVFKLIHATQDVPLIKMNLSKRQENIYRLYADKIATNGKKIPYLDKGAIFKWDKVMGKDKSVAVYIEHYEDESGAITPILCEFGSNGSIVIKANFNTSLTPDAINELFVKEVNPVINVVKDYLAQDGYVLNNFTAIKDHEILNLEYAMHIQIEKDINIKKIVGCLTSVFNVINDNLTNGIMLRFKRVSNYNEMESQEALILDMTEPHLGYTDHDIIKVLQTNFQLSEKAAAEKYAEVKRAQEVMQSGNKRLKKGNNPGFLTTIVKQLYTNNTVMINVSGINHIGYLDTLQIYLDSLIRISQKQTSTQVSKADIKKKCTGQKIAEEVHVDEIIAPNEQMTIVAEELVFNKPGYEMANEIEANEIEANEIANEIAEEPIDEDDLLARFGYDEDANEVAIANEEGGASPASDAADEDLQDEYMDVDAAQDEAAQDEAASDDEEEDLKTDITGQSLANPSPFEKRMIKHDKNLFVTDNGKKNFKSYATTCPWNRRRQPVLLTDEEKTRIDTEHPGSYSEAVQYGTNPDKKFWYICPRYWDLKTNSSLTEAEVDKDLVIPKKPPKNKVPAGKHIFEFNDYGIEHLDEKKNYITHHPGFLKPDEKGKCLPCCFKSWSEPEQTKRRAQCTNDNTIVVPPGRKKKKAAEEIDEYILAPDKFPILQENRFGYLPIAVQKFLHTDNKKCQISEMNTNIKQNHECLLRHSVEINHNQSFIACIADIWFENYRKLHKEKTRPTIKRMKEIFMETLTIDHFVTLQNGNLIKLFYQDSTADAIDHYAEVFSANQSKLYELADKTKPEQVRALIKIARAYANFLDYLKDDTVEIDYEYLWDLICKPNPKLFANGINMVIIELTRKDITDSVDLICPSNHYSASFFDSNKHAILILKIDNFYEPIYAYKTNEDEITITRTFSVKYKDVLPNIKYVLSLVKKTFSSKCAALPSMPMIYKFEKPLPLEKLIYDLQLNHYVIDKQVMDYDSKIIGVIAINNQDNSKGFVPCHPSAPLLVQSPVVYMNEAHTESYTDTRDFLEQVYKKTKRLIPCKPYMKVLEDGLIVGILTMTNQFVQISEPVQDTFGQDLKIMQNINYQAADTTLSTSTPADVDSERVNYIKKIQLETKFYNVFRTTARYLLGQYENKDIRREIEEKTKSNQLYLKKLRSVETLLRDLMQDYVEFYNYSEEDLLKLDTITNCYTNCNNAACHTKEPAEPSSSEKPAAGTECTLRIPETNLINAKPNATFYYGKLADEIVRYSRIKNFIFNPKSVLSFSKLKYNLRENEIILLQSLLTKEYFENIIAAKVNSYIKNNTYETTQPIIGQKYPNTDNTYIKNVESDEDCPVTVKDHVANKYWQAIFPLQSKEYIHASEPPSCSFQALVTLIRDHVKDTELTKNAIKTVLVSEYRKLFAAGQQQQILLIFRAQGKKLLAGQIAQKQISLEDMIVSEEYYVTNLDAWILAVYYNLPLIFISETILIENYKKLFIANRPVGERDVEEQAYYFLKMTAIFPQVPPTYTIIRLAEQMLISVGSIRDADVQAELRRAPPGNTLPTFIENFSLTEANTRKRTIKIAPKKTQVPAEQVPAEQVPAEQVPAEQVPAEQVPAEQVPVPAEQVPVPAVKKLQKKINIKKA